MLVKVLRSVKRLKQTAPIHNYTTQIEPLLTFSVTPGLFLCIYMLYIFKQK